jgi:undecaprenyl-diphosphatase
MSDWIAIVLLGAIEGVTEFLPVSSTGHLLLAEHWLGHQSDLFNVVIQSATVLAVLVVFKDRVLNLLTHCREAAAQGYLLKLIVAFGITGAGGLVLKKLNFRLPEETTPVALATLIGGVLFVLVERWLRGRSRSDEVTWPIAVTIGAAQLLAAVFPGTSRSGATILLALVMGLGRPVATEFSFLLGVPTLLAAGGLKVVEALRHPAGDPVNWGLIGLASLVAVLTAFVAVKWLVRFVQNHTFEGFGWYRIVLGIAILALVRS